MQKERRGRLAHLIQEEVKAQVKRYVMARTREDFINRLTEVLGPALSHHYRQTLGTLNGRTDQIDKWRQHADDFLTQFSDRLLEPTKAKNLDRRKAVQRAVTELMETDLARRRKETANFQQTYKLRTFDPLPEDADEGFYTKVQGIVDVVFPQ